MAEPFLGFEAPVQFPDGLAPLVDPALVFGFEPVHQVRRQQLGEHVARLDDLAGTLEVGIIVAATKLNGWSVTQLPPLRRRTVDRVSLGIAAVARDR